MVFQTNILDTLSRTLHAKYYPIWNGIAFQLAWPICVLGGNAVAALTTLVFIAGHLRAAPSPRVELTFIAVSGFVGLIVDIGLIRSGILVWNSPLPPLWMSCLWLLFGATVGHSFSWFNKRLVLASVFAGLFAPLSYKAGTFLTEVDLRQPELSSLIIIGLCWSVILPTFLLIYRRFRALAL